MKFLKSKLFLILICVALVLTVVPAVLSAMGHTGIVRQAFLTVTYPVRAAFNAVARGFRGFGEYFTQYSTLKEENESLKQELDELQSKLDRADVALDENEWLRGYFGISEEMLKLELIDANVVGYSTGNTDTVYMLDKGSVNGVAVNMAVITEDGIVGCVTEVGLNWCKITSIIEDSFAVGAYVARTGDHGIVRGDYSRRADGTCLMSSLSENSDVKEGDLVLSSGIGSVYPVGITVGRVISVSSDPATRTKTAVIEPSAKFDNIKKVMIIKSYTVSETEADESTAEPS